VKPVGKLDALVPASAAVVIGNGSVKWPRDLITKVFHPEVSGSPSAGKREITDASLIEVEEIEEIELGLVYLLSMVDRFALDQPPQGRPSESARFGSKAGHDGG